MLCWESEGRCHHTLYSDSALPDLNKTSLKIINALLSLNWHFFFRLADQVLTWTKGPPGASSKQGKATTSVNFCGCATFAVVLFTFLTVRERFWTLNIWNYKFPFLRIQYNILYQNILMIGETDKIRDETKAHQERTA